MTEKIELNSSFQLFMHDTDEWVDCELHYIELYGDATSEVAGKVVITIDGKSKSEYDLWGNGEDDERLQNDYDGCYVCFPTIYNDEEAEEYKDEYQCEIWHFSELL
jgi:hypothetical protein